MRYLIEDKQQIPPLLLSWAQDNIFNKLNIIPSDELLKKNNRIIEHVKDIWREIEYETEIKVVFNEIQCITKMFLDNTAGLVNTILRIVIHKPRSENNKLNNTDYEYIDEAYERSFYLMNYLINTGTAHNPNIYEYNSVKSAGKLNRESTQMRGFLFSCKDSKQGHYDILENTIKIYSENDVYFTQIIDFLHANIFKNSNFMVINYVDAHDNNIIINYKKVMLTISINSAQNCVKLTFNL